MKWVNFKILVLIVGLAPGMVLARGSEVTKEPKAVVLTDQDEWTTNLKKTCIETTGRNNGTSRVKNVDAGCACIARNSIQLALREETVKEAVEDLQWIKRFLQDKISDRELEKDPLGLVEFIYDFGDACAKDVDYRHKF